MITPLNLRFENDLVWKFNSIALSSAKESLVESSNESKPKKLRKSIYRLELLEKKVSEKESGSRTWRMMSMSMNTKPKY